MMRRRWTRGRTVRAVATSTAVVALVSSILVVGIESVADAVSVTGTIAVQTNPLDVALNPAGTVAYVANFTSNTISVINVATNSVTATITVGTNPCRVVVDPMDTYAYVANAGSNNVSVIQLSTDTVVNTLALPANAFPEQIVVNSSNTDAYVVDRGTNQISVIALPSDTVTTPIATGLNMPEGIYVNSQDAYVTNRTGNNVTEYDLTSYGLVATIPVGSSPSHIAANPSGTFLYVTNKFDNTVSVIRVSDNAIVATIPVGNTPDSVAVDPSGQDAYISNTGTPSNSVSVINLSVNSVVQTLPVGTGPEGIAITPAGTYAYVVNYSSNTVSVIEIANRTVTFDPHGATSGTMAPQTNNVPANLTTNSFIRRGYKFAGWSTSPSGGPTTYADGASYPFTSSTTLYAQWTVATDAFGYVAGTGATGTPPSSGSGADGSTITLAPNTFTRAGYSFSGWNDGSATYPAGYTYTLASNGAPILFTAQWTNGSDAFGYAAGTGATGTPPSSGSGADGSTITLAPNTFTRAGYSFSGWNDGAATYPAGYTYTLASNGAPILFTAQWTAKSPLPPTVYTVTFNANGGSGTMPPETSAAARTLERNTFVRPGYIFVGWNTDPKGNATAYPNEANYPFTASVTLYAQWFVTFPPAPTRLTANLSGGAIVLRWSTPAGADGSAPLGYNIFRGTSSDQEWRRPVNGVKLIAKNSFRITSLRHGTNFYFRVKAVTVLGSTKASNEAMVSVPAYVYTRLSLSPSKSTVSRGAQRSLEFILQVTPRGSKRALAGTVKITAGFRFLCQAVVSKSGFAECALPGNVLHVGVHSIVASYGGDFNDHGSKTVARLRIS